MSAEDVLPVKLCAAQAAVWSRRARKSKEEWGFPIPFGQDGGDASSDALAFGIHFDLP